MTADTAEVIPPERPPLTFASADTKFRWRAVLINPTFTTPPSFVNRLKFWWGQDIWFGRWPVLKIQAALVAAAELARWLT